MDLISRRSLCVILLICPYILVFVIIMNTRSADAVYTGIRLCGLFGFLSLSIGVMMNLLKKEIRTLFGHPFIRVHHAFVLSGLVLITVHPILYALSAWDLSVFVPDISSLYSFLMNGGRVAIILIYTGFLAVVFRTALKGRWIQIHRVMYVALILGIIHANMLGQDLADPVVRILYDTIAGVVVLTGIIQMRNRSLLNSRRKPAN